MKIVILTDSYGGPRVSKNVTDVFTEQTYPELVKSELMSKGHDVIVDYLSYRKVTEIPELLQKYSNADIYILQAGLVDVHPHVLKHKLTASQTFFAKTLRRIIRSKRSFFIKYVRSITWSSEAELKIAIEKILKIVKTKLIWINIAPVNQYMDADTPGANRSIKNYNSLLAKTTSNSPNSTILDIFSILSEQKNFERYLHPVDSHLNVLGNQFYADQILNILKQTSNV